MFANALLNLTPVFGWDPKKGGGGRPEGRPPSLSASPWWLDVGCYVGSGVGTSLLPECEGGFPLFSLGGDLLGVLVVGVHVVVQHDEPVEPVLGVGAWQQDRCVRPP